jgi:uroporphyrinogen-III synthase
MLKYLRHVPIYTVGPATSRALRTISHDPPLNVFGSETGNGEALAHYMLDHYAGWYPQRTLKPPLLFLVGEQRRDIIPKTLMNPDLPQIERIGVDELVVYETGVMESFGIEFESYLDQTKDAEIRWVVVFSPMGCEVMLRTLRLLDESTGKVRTGDRGGGCGARRGRRQTYIATIGPTTRDYLRKTFGFEPDVCAEKPSPEGIGEAIGGYMARIRAEHEAER